LFGKFKWELRTFSIFTAQDMRGVAAGMPAKQNFHSKHLIEQ